MLLTLHPKLSASSANWANSSPQWPFWKIQWTCLPVVCSFFHVSSAAQLRGNIASTMSCIRTNNDGSKSIIKQLSYYMDNLVTDKCQTIVCHSIRYVKHGYNQNYYKLDYVCHFSSKIFTLNRVPDDTVASS